MKIIMLSWEYPPKNVGGLSNHVYYLSQALNKLGHEIHVITCEEENAPEEENDNGVFVHRVTPYKIDTEDFTKWIMQLNFAMVERVAKLIREIGKVDIIHAHDWLSAFSAKNLKWSFNIPMVCTIHATEYGRNGGIRTEMQKYISSTEWLLTYEAWKVVACSNYMRQQISDVFKTPWEKIWVIPNGVDTDDFDFEFDWIDFRRRYAMDDEKIIFYVGRHVYEKGIHLLIDAAPDIIGGYNKAKFVIAGKGPMTCELKDRVRQMGIEDKVLFTGYMSDEDRNKLYRVANVAVFPSLYEPFGIVALEAMAAGCPVVVSDTGGLSEIIEHKENGLKSINGSAESLRDNIYELLWDEGLANYVKENGLNTVKEKYTWDIIAHTTADMYCQVLDNVKGTQWGNNVKLEDKKVQINKKDIKESEEEKEIKKEIKKEDIKEAKKEIKNEEIKSKEKSIKEEEAKETHQVNDKFNQELKKIKDTEVKKQDEKVKDVVNASKTTITSNNKSEEDGENKTIAPKRKRGRKSKKVQ